MNMDDFFGYLVATDQVDEFLGLKEDRIVKCPNCDSDLYIYENNMFYCKKCNNLFNIETKKKVYNKKLTFQEKMEINSMSE